MLHGPGANSVPLRKTALPRVEKCNLARIGRHLALARRDFASPCTGAQIMSGVNDAKEQGRVCHIRAHVGQRFPKAVNDPIADVRALCNFIVMRRSLALWLTAFWGFSGCTSVPPSSVQSDPTPRLVHGFLDAHWEYPNFLPDDVANEVALPFYFVEGRWTEYYAKPVAEGMRDRPDETVCFRVVGEGYVSPRKPINMWSARRQFVFTKVIEMTQLPSGLECAKRGQANDS